VSAIRRASGATGDDTIEIELTSNRRFLPHGELLVLRIGRQEFDVSRYRTDGGTNRVIFTLTAAEFAQVAAGDAMSVHCGANASGNGWNFGKIDKSILR
jgi:hypothetical protein